MTRINAIKNTNPDSAYKVAAKLIKTANLEKNSLYEAKFLMIMGAIQYQKDNNSEAEIWFNKSLVLYKKIGDLSGEAKIYNNLGIIAKEANDTKKALMYQNQGLELRLRINDPLLSSSYNNIGIIYKSEGDYANSSIYYLKGLEIAEKNKDKLLTSSILNNLGNIYWAQRRYDEAFEYIQKCLSIEKERNDYMSISGSYINMTGIKMDQGNYEDATKYCKQAIIYAEKINSTKQLGVAYAVLCDLEYRKSNYNQAVEYGITGLEKRRKIGNQLEIVRSLLSLSKPYMELKNFSTAEKNLIEALKLCKQNSFLTEKENCYRLLARMYNRMEMWEKANDYYILRDEARDSLFNETNSKIIFNLKTKYETEKKEARIVLLDKENSIQSLLLKNNRLTLEQNNNLITQQEQRLTINQLELQNKNQLLKNQKLDAEKKAQNIKTLKKQSLIQNLELKNRALEIKRRNQFIALISLLFLTIVVIVYVVYNRYRLKQKNLLQQEIFKQQEIATQSLFEGEQQERIRIARDLHDSIGQMLSVVKMNVSTIADNENENSILNKTATLIDRTIDEVRHISHNLIPEELNFGLFNALESLCGKMSSGKTSVKFQLSEDIEQYNFEKQNELSIYRIVQEAINNMIKHAGATEINVQISRVESLMVIKVKDNGKGFDTSEIQKSKGLGWKNIAARVNMLNGKLEVSSERLTGTEIEISIPEWNKTTAV